LAVALYIAISNYELLPGIFKLIFTEAFQFNAAAGGFFGAMISMAMMMGSNVVCSQMKQVWVLRRMLLLHQM
jgi:Na+/alanine symporter